MTPVTGHQLRVERVAANVSVNGIAEAMGVSRTTIWALERRALVSEAHAQSFRDAIARLTKAAA